MRLAADKQTRKHPQGSTPGAPFAVQSSSSAPVPIGAAASSSATALLERLAEYQRKAMREAGAEVS